MSEPEEKETLASIALDLLAFIDETSSRDHEIDGALIVVSTKAEDGGHLFMRTIDGQPVWATAGLIEGARLNTQARWHGWDEEGEGEGGVDD